MKTMMSADGKTVIYVSDDQASRLYHEDGLRHSIRDVDSWVTKTFFALSSFK